MLAKMGKDGVGFTMIKRANVTPRLHLQYSRYGGKLEIKRANVTPSLHQRTNGPVNAHLISGTSISRKHSEPI